MTTQTAATRARAVEPPVVLCVDDERFVLRSLREQLRRGLSQTCTVEVAESGEEALELVEELTGEGAALAVVISDHLMPRMKGDELLTRIHARSPDTLTVLLTGQASAEAVGNAVNHASLYRYIEKPWQSADLLITIEQALDSFLTEQELRDTSLRLRRSQEVVRQLADTKRELESRMRELSGALVELRATQRRLVEAEKMAALGGLVAGVAHEINTPLGIGITAASLLRDKTSAFVGSYRRGGVTRNELERYLGTADESCLLILRNLERAAALVRDFKQVAVDQSSEAKREFVVKDYLGTIVQGLSPALRRTSHAVEIVGDERLTLHSYPGALSQIITNLVMNSLVHAFAADERGRVVIEFWSAPGGALLLRYSDNGRGIGSDSIKKIFDPFFTTNRGNGSSGLGLQILSTTWSSRSCAARSVATAPSATGPCSRSRCRATQARSGRSKTRPSPRKCERGIDRARCGVRSLRGRAVVLPRNRWLRGTRAFSPARSSSRTRDAALVSLPARSRADRTKRTHAYRAHANLSPRSSSRAPAARARLW